MLSIWFSIGPKGAKENFLAFGRVLNWFATRNLRAAPNGSLVGGFMLN